MAKRRWRIAGTCVFCLGGLLTLVTILFVSQQTLCYAVKRLQDRGADGLADNGTGVTDPTNSSHATNNNSSSSSSSGGSDNRGNSTLLVNSTNVTNGTSHILTNGTA